MRRTLFSLVFVFYFIHSSLAQPCYEESSGRNGECLDLRKCKEKYEIYKTNKILPQICDRQKHTICCPEKRPPTTTTTFRPSNRISARMCQEYAKHLIHSETFNNSLGNVITKTYSECGHTTHNLYTHNIADAKEFPHMALIGYDEGHNQKYKCAGALISEQWVISTVYCLRDKVLGDAKHIQLGGIKRVGEYEPNSEIFSIKRAVKDEQYTELSIELQIVLFEMTKPATLNPSILPICFPQSDEIPKNVAIATGWSTTEPDNEISSILLKINMHYFPKEACEKFEEVDYRNNLSPHIDYQNMLCAGTNNTCQNDPGSILQYCSEHINCMYIITGVIARTKCNTDGVTLYTKVFPYLDWIESYVWPNQ